MGTDHVRIHEPRLQIRIEDLLKKKRESGRKVALGNVFQPVDFSRDSDICLHRREQAQDGRMIEGS